MHQEISRELDALAAAVVDSAFRVHTTLGPGLLESAYQSCLEIELGRRSVAYSSQCLLPVRYEGNLIENAYRIDLLVGEELVVELKSVEQLLPIHSAQLLTYMRLSGKRPGLLINFNATRIKDGIKRIAL